MVERFRNSPTVAKTESLPNQKPVSLWEEDPVTHEPVYRHKHFTFFPKENLVVRSDNGANVHLGLIQNKVLIMLADNSGRFVKSRDLFKRVWMDGFPHDRGLGLAIWKIRKKIEPDLDSPRIIVSRQSYGYMLKDERVKDFTFEQLPLSFGFNYDSDKGVLIFTDGKIVFLKPLENQILRLLTANFGKPVHFSQFGRFSNVKSRDALIGVIQVRMTHLRNNMGEERNSGLNNRLRTSCIRSVRGYGYKLVDRGMIEEPRVAK